MAQDCGTAFYGKRTFSGTLQQSETAAGFDGRHEMEPENDVRNRFLMDSGKILSETSKTCLTGKRFYDILLKQYHLQMEMAAGNYVTAIMTCCDTADGWQRLWDALKEIDDFCVAADEPVQENRKLLAYPVLKQQISLTDALDAPKAQVPLTEAAGQTAGAFINLYPPGIPIVAPGEQITQEAVDVITRYRQMNLPVQGVDHDAITILKLC